MPGRRTTGALAGALLTVAALAAPIAAPAADRIVLDRGGPAGRVPDEVIVQFERGADASDRADARAEAGTAAPHNLGSRGLEVVRISDGESVGETIRELEADPAVKLAEPNRIEQPLGPSDDSLFGSLWGLDNSGQTVNGTAGAPDADIDAPEAWDIGTGDTGTVVAIMDTGLDQTHPDLAANVWQNPGEVAGNGVDDDGNGFVDDFNGYDFIGAGDANPFDDGGHGTHVAGTAAGVGNNALGTTGVAQRASIMVLRVCSVFGCSVSDQIEAINYAAANGARVLNGSLGGPSSTENLTRRDAIFSHPEVLHVFAAGNEGDNVDTPPATFPCAHAPQGNEIDNVLCVAATNQSDTRPGFSNFGAVSVDLGAPGTNILSDSASKGVFSDNFDANDFATRWSQNPGDANNWASSTENPPLTSRGIAEVVTGNYANNTTYGTRSEEISVGSVMARGCELRFFDAIALGAGDTFRIALLHNGSVVREYEHVDGDSFDNTQGTEVLPFEVPGGAGNLRIRFRLVSNDDGMVAAGVHIDNVTLTCAETPGPHDFEFLNGTSMASPHVAGAATLLAARNPGASTTEIRDKLLATVDPNASLAGITTSGGRLNIGSAMAAMPADTSITGGPAEGAEIGGGLSKRRAGPAPGARPTFSYASNDPATTFQCAVDGAAFASCGGGSQTIGPLLAGPHTFAVRSVDPRGNTDTTPATRSFTVEGVAPNTRITKSPKKRTEADGATFRFKSNEAGSSFECRIDRRQFRSCKPPKRYKGLDPAKHKFKVRATDAAGNVDPSAAKKRWRVTAG